MTDPTPVRDSGERQLGLEELFDFGACSGENGCDIDGGDTGLSVDDVQPVLEGMASGPDFVADDAFSAELDSSNLNWEQIDQFIGSIQGQTVADNAFSMDFDTDIDQFIGSAQDHMVTDNHALSMDFGRAHGYSEDAPVGREISLGMDAIGPANDFYAALGTSFVDAGGYCYLGPQVPVPDIWAIGTTSAIEYGQWLPGVPQQTRGYIVDSQPDAAHDAPVFSGSYDHPFDNTFHDANSSAHGLFATRQCPPSELGSNGDPLDGPRATASAQLSALKRSNDPMTADGWPGTAGHQGPKHPKLRHIPDTMCFDFVLTDPRAKNKGRERQSEINAMRLTGACFRCKMLKLQVSRLIRGQ